MCKVKSGYVCTSEVHTGTHTANKDFNGFFSVLTQYRICLHDKLETLHSPCESVENNTHVLLRISLSWWGNGDIPNWWCTQLEKGLLMCAACHCLTCRNPTRLLRYPSSKFVNKLGFGRRGLIFPCLHAYNACKIASLRAFYCQTFRTSFPVLQKVFIFNFSWHKIEKIMANKPGGKGGLEWWLESDRITLDM